MSMPVLTGHDACFLAWLRARVTADFRQLPAEAERLISAGLVRRVRGEGFEGIPCVRVALTAAGYEVS